MGTKLGVVPMMSTYPAPNRQNLLACRAVRTPAMMRTAKTAHET